MIPLETIVSISAILTVGLFTSLVASYLSLSNVVESKVKSIKESYVEQRTKMLMDQWEEVMKTYTLTPPKDELEVIRTFWKNAAFLDIKLVEEIYFKTYDVRNNLTTMRESIFLSIILFIVTIVLSMTTYSSYSFLTFLIGFLVLLYASYRLTRILSGI